MYRVKIADSDVEQLQSWLFASMPKEVGAFALAGVSQRRNATDILVRRPIQVPRRLFRVQREERLEISSEAINGLAGLCEANGLGVVVCHSHPENTPYSRSDDFGEQRIFESLRPFVPSKAPLVSLLFHPTGVGGRIWLPDQRVFVPIPEIVVVGRSLRRITAEPQDYSSGALNAVYDRQVRAFGEEGQCMISRAKVGIIGVGGTGSPTAEQLARLGVKDIVLMDPDEFSASNLTRMYGTFAPRNTWWLWPWRSRTAQKKVDLVARHLEMIQPGIQVNRIAQSVVLRSSAHCLLDRDVLFLCTDEHWGRSVVNEVAYQYLIPTINMGMSIRSEAGQISGATGGIDVLRPGTACLWCSQFLNPDRITAESLPWKERVSRRREGYVADIDTPAPSVISVTTAISGMAVTMFLQLVTDFMGPSGAVSRLRYDLMEGTVRRCTTAVSSECVCQKAKGFGDMRALPLLDRLPDTR